MDDAHHTARRAAAEAGVEIRALTSLAEAEAVVAVERTTWGDGQTVPRELIRAFQGAGVPPLGAYAGRDLIGFVMGFVGAGDDGIHVHSHMLAVLPAGRGRGVGRALKLAQRAWALDQGIALIRWTFDPMIVRNAHLNLNVLGAVADRFHRHYYGDMPDEINRGERTDRLDVRWDLHADPGSSVTESGRIPVHPDHERLRAEDPRAAAAERDRVADQLEAAIAAGSVVAGFDRTTSEYVLAPPGTGRPRS